MSSYPWFRYYSETIKDKKIDLIAEESNLGYLNTIGAWSSLLCMANDSPVRGSLYVTLQKRYTDEYIIKTFRLSEEEGGKLINLFIEYDMIDIDENQAYRIKNWDKRQFKSDFSKERVKDHRKRKKEQQQENDDCNVTPVLHVTGDSASASASVLDSLNELSVWTDVTGMLAYPSKARDEAPYFIRSLLSQHGEKTSDYCKPFYQEWLNRKYSKTNHGWLDWAISGEITPLKKGNNSTNLNDNGKKKIIKIDGVSHEIGLA